MHNGPFLCSLTTLRMQHRTKAEKVLNDKVVYIIPNMETKPVKLVVEPELIDIANSAIARVDDTLEVQIRWTAGANVVTGSAIGAFIQQP